MKLASASEMQQLDRTTIEQFQIPGIVLMENAGRGTVDYLLRTLGPVKGRSVLIFSGPGNNGGDGLVIARRLHQHGGKPFIISLVSSKKLKGDAATNYKSISELKIPFVTIQNTDTLDAFQLDLPELTLPLWAIVDSVFGTGLQRPLTGHFEAAVNCMNRLRKTTGCPVVAVDIPSGLNAETGETLGVKVKTDHTVTYGLAKPGHFMNGGAATGKLHVVDIGIPDEVVSHAKLKGEAITDSVLKLFTERPRASHKGNYGHLLVLAGSAGKTGAAYLTGLGALRVGAGLVTLAVPADLRTVFESNLFEAMTLLLPDSRRYPSIEDYQRITQNLSGKSAMIIGPGIGTAEKTCELVIKLYNEAEIPMVIDADGLNFLATEPRILANPPAPRILTPHPGEMSRLAGLKTKEIQANRLETTLKFTQSVNENSKNVTTVLKGAGTIICDPNGKWAINTTGNPGMAAGGMGDTLTGIIGGLLAQGVSPAKAARTGVYIHGYAADEIACKRKFGYLASEVADIVPYLITKYEENTFNISGG